MKTMKAIPKLLLTGTLLVLSVSLGAQEAAGAALRDSDCAKCHTGPAADLAFAGAAHDKVSCSGCHEGHPPKAQVTIPACGKCHRGKPHFGKASCGSCHANPHMPLRVTMSLSNSQTCMECHPSPVALIEKGTSAHSGQSCADCHLAHRQAPSCDECHDPHALTASAPRCTACHQPHMPKPVVYSYDVPDSECASCHRRPFDLLRAGSTGHSRRACVSCHKERHGTVLSCPTCHGLPHRLQGEALFDNCNECHRTAHDLEVWPGGKTAGRAKKKSEQDKIPEGLLPFLERGRTDEHVRDLPP